MQWGVSEAAFWHNNSTADKACLEGVEKKLGNANQRKKCKTPYDNITQIENNNHFYNEIYANTFRIGNQVYLTPVENKCNESGLDHIE